MNPSHPQQGDILISEPSALGDITFNRSVILLTHYDKKGAVGFILNKPLNHTLEEFIPEIEHRFTIFNGGPVEQDNLYFIHNVPHLIPNSVKVIDGVYWGGSFEVIVDLINSKHINSSQIKFFLGYSGWDESQLEMEIDFHTWIIDQETKPTEIIQSHQDAEFWQEKMKKLGGDYLIWSNAPENPNYN